MNLIDSHCHLHYDYAPKSRADIIREAKNAGVITFINIATDLPTLPEIQKLSEEHEEVYHTVGVHPHDVAAIKDEDLETLEVYSQHPKCRAIGEIGLDFHYDHSPHAIQFDRLEQQLDLALKTKLPVVIHSREAETELLEALKRYANRVPSSQIPGVIHCFSGTLEFGKSCLDLGFYISFSGILTFKNAEDLRTAARTFPLEKILVETDSPYLAPVPFRGKKCEPAMVLQTALKLAELKGVGIEEIARVTTLNARRVFRV